MIGEGQVKTVHLQLPSLHPRQRQFVMDPHRIVVAACGSKFGKLLRTDEPIPTPIGFVAMGDLKVGDRVFGADGQPTTVTFKSEVEYPTVYRVTFTDGTTIEAGADHQWAVWDDATLQRLAGQGLAAQAHDALRVLTTQQMVEEAGALHMPVCGAFHMPVCGPVQFDPASLGVPPYLRASVEARKAMLAGFLDENGQCLPHGQVVFHASNEHLAHQVKELAESLGCLVTERRQYLWITAPFNPFRRPDQAAKWQPVPGVFRRTVARIDPVPVTMPMQCIAVDSPDSLYLAGRSYLVTHNTHGLSVACILDAWNNKGHLVWWVAPTFKQAQIAYDFISRILPPSRYKPNKASMQLSLVGVDGREWSRIEFRSADNPESLRGSGVHFAVIDEAAYVSDPGFVSVWTTLTRTRGKLRIISTPKGRGTFFYDQWCKGWFPELREKHPEYQSYQFPTSDNPYVPKEAIEEFKRNLPADVFAQEIEAKWLDAGAGVFRGIRACQTAQWRNDPERGALYVIGVDWAKLHDATVFTVANRLTKEVCYIERLTEMDWNIQIKLLIDLAKKWNQAAVLMDATGLGDVPLDAVRSVYSNVEGYVIGNNKSKVALIQKLQIAFENGTIRIPPPGAHAAAGLLDYELSIYEYQLSSSGNLIYSAPEGRNDDHVISLALANWLMQSEQLVYRARSVRGL